MKRKLRSVLKDTLPKVATDTVKLVQETEIPVSASALAYTTILSVIPLIAVSLAALKLFGGFEQIADTVEPFIFENLAQGSDEKTLAIFHTFVDKTRFGTVGIGGVIGLLLTSASMLGRIEQTINRIWKAPDRRSIARRAGLYLFFITVGPLALALAIAGATVLDLPLSKVLPSGTPFFFILVGIFYGMYRYLPYRAVYWRAALVASIGTSSVWTIAKILYGIYVRKFVTYDRVYGSLGAIPIFLVWTYVAWLVVLTGAAFSASLQWHYLKGEEPPHARNRKKPQIATP